MHSILELNSNPRYKDANEIHVLFYADDMKVFILVQNWLDHKKLKAAIEIIKTFCNPSGMNLNIAKTCILKIRKQGRRDDYTYDVDGVPIVVREDFDDLGVVITDKRSRMRHYQKIKNKIRSLVGICKRNLRHTGVSLASNIYRTYVVPLVTQSAPVTFAMPEKHDTAGLVKVENKQGLGDFGITKVLESLTKHFFTICGGKLRGGLECNLSLVEHSKLEWLREINRSYYAELREAD